MRRGYRGRVREGTASWQPGYFFQHGTQRGDGNGDDHQFRAFHGGGKICAQIEVFRQRDIRKKALVAARGAHRLDLGGIDRPQRDAVMGGQADGKRGSPCSRADNGNVHIVGAQFISP
ncbi:MAG: hypothetical protein A3H99_05440 [Gallionellales bacterium RIFCSPLOWO2_02_FULL_59_110]|nr:MAG: hypothetical protein A3H99_05440 [Gallionellales bacterium RIFCSPLOWO2_02_FULL_59_110]